MVDLKVYKKEKIDELLESSGSSESFEIPTVNGTITGTSEDGLTMNGTIDDNGVNLLRNNSIVKLNISGISYNAVINGSGNFVFTNIIYDGGKESLAVQLIYIDLRDKTFQSKIMPVSTSAQVNEEPVFLLDLTNFWNENATSISAGNKVTINDEEILNKLTEYFASAGTNSFFKPFFILSPWSTSFGLKMEQADGGAIVLSVLIFASFISLEPIMCWAHLELTGSGESISSATLQLEKYSSESGTSMGSQITFRESSGTLTEDEMEILASSPTLDATISASFNNIAYGRQTLVRHGGVLMPTFVGNDAIIKVDSSMNYEITPKYTPNDLAIISNADPANSFLYLQGKWFSENYKMGTGITKTDLRNFIGEKYTISVVDGVLTIKENY